MATPDLPQLSAPTVFLTDAGLETDLIFHHGIDLPAFAAFPLLDHDHGRETIRTWFQQVIDIAARVGTGAVLETPTWRANAEWGAALGHDAAELDRLNRVAVALFQELREANPALPVVISGNVGPRGDGYVAGDAPTADAAGRYHLPQIRSLAEAGADLVSALTINQPAEAIGIVLAARHLGVPVVISFTVETDGRLPSAVDLADAITAVDEATDAYAAYFMVNCAHPTHFAHVLEGPGPWHRIRGIRANASRMSHEELDAATELDRGDEADLAARNAELAALLPALAVVGGCCGTDHRHLEHLADTVIAPAVAADLAGAVTPAAPVPVAEDGPLRS